MTETIVLAFLPDPTWGPALAVPDGSIDHLAPFWRPYVEQAVEDQTAYVWDDAHAVALWTPPGQPELSRAREAEIGVMIDRLYSAEHAAKLYDFFETFERVHPDEPPHAYLGFLATHPQFRGQGIGQQLLAATLAHWDELGVPSYLESSNPVNLHRYERAGFVPRDQFASPFTGAVLTTMWREVPSP